MRAQRFGAGDTPSAAATPTAPAGRVLDVEKKLERARRFGLPVDLTPKSDAERKQARSERFGDANGSAEKPVSCLFVIPSCDLVFAFGFAKDTHGVQGGG